MVHSLFIVLIEYETILRLHAKLLAKQLSPSAGRREPVKMMKQVKNGVDLNGHVDMDAVHKVASASNS